MRKLIKIICLLALAACQREEALPLPEVQGQLGTEYGLLENQKLVITSGGPGQLVVQATRIQDGRCPEDVVCFSEGNVDVTAKISFATQDPQTVNLCLGACYNSSAGNVVSKRIDSVYFMAGNTRHLIFLKKVDPYPVLKGMRRPSTAFLVVEQRP